MIRFTGPLSLVALAVSAACTPALPPPPKWSAPATSVARSTLPAAEGSLWRDSSSMLDLFSDPRARKVGDVLTVKIVESAEALKSASTKTSRDSSLSASVTGFFGAPISASILKPEASGALKNDFEGSGTTQRKDTLVATLTAKVVDVLPQGLLRVEGYREVIINHERQYLLLRGVVRPEDVGPDNSILSTAIADAQIAYSGAGVVSDKQRPGWLGRILDHLWPF